MNNKVKELQNLANKLDSLKDFVKRGRKNNYTLYIAEKFDYIGLIKRFPDNPDGKEFIDNLISKHFEEIQKEISEEIDRIDNYLNNNFR